LVKARRVERAAAVEGLTEAEVPVPVPVPVLVPVKEELMPEEDVEEAAGSELAMEDKDTEDSALVMVAPVAVADTVIEEEPLETAPAIANEPDVAKILVMFPTSTASRV